MNNFKNLIWGIVLVTIGIIFGLNELNITNINIFFDGWWTLFIIVPCVIGLFNDDEKTGSIIGILIGIILLLGCQAIITFDLVWKLMLPLVLIVIGLSFIFKDTFNSKINKEIKKINENKTKDGGYCSTFSSQKVSFSDEEFNGTDVSAIFGAVEIDLTDAIIKKDVVINASAVFGGIDIRVPKNMKVKIKSNSIFGGVSEKRRNIKETSSSQTIYINASCMFGGVEIK